jgi:hypothetical protein
MFNASLPPALGVKEYKGQVYTMWPHPNHRCDCEVEEDYLDINYQMKIIGAGRDKTTIHGGGFLLQREKDDGKNVVLQDMAMKGSSECGLFAQNGLSFLCKRMTFTQCGYRGVVAWNTEGRLINCVITQCKWSGIACGDNTLIELEGDQTKVDGNVTSGRSYDYGLETWSTSSIIHLLFPLTKESVSTNNHGGRNYGTPSWGTPGTIKQLIPLKK